MIYVLLNFIPLSISMSEDSKTRHMNEMIDTIEAMKNCLIHPTSSPICRKYKAVQQTTDDRSLQRSRRFMPAQMAIPRKNAELVCKSQPCQKTINNWRVKVSLRCHFIHISRHSYNII